MKITIDDYYGIYNGEKMDKGVAILEAIRNCKVGEDIIIHNNDQSVWCVLKLVCREHGEA